MKGLIMYFLECYGCEKHFLVNKEDVKGISIGRNKAWCDKCWNELQEFRQYAKENEI